MCLCFCCSSLCFNSTYQFFFSGKQFRSIKTRTTCFRKFLTKSNPNIKLKLVVEGSAEVRERMKFKRKKKVKKKKKKKKKQEEEKIPTAVPVEREGVE